MDRATGDNTIDTCQQRQEDEFLCIQAIYPNEVKDLRVTKAWKNWKPLELQITLFPSVSISGPDVSTQVELYVRCSENYPNSIPFIDIQNSKGLSNKDVAELKEELQKVAHEHLGQEMLLQLITTSQYYLSEHKKPHYESFHAEMIHNQMQQQKEILEKEKKERDTRKLEEQQKILAIEMERNRKLEELKNANRKSKLTDAIQVSPSSSEKNIPERQRSRSESNCRELCTGTIRTTVKFSGKKEHSVFCGKCLNHNSKGSVVYYAMDTTTGDPVIVIKWILQWSNVPKSKTEEHTRIRTEQENYMKQLCSIEQEFKTLRQLKHDNIVLYLGMSYELKKDKIIISVLQEYVSGCSLSLMSKGVPLSLQQLQIYSCHVLHAIQYLHENSIVHRNLRDTSIFINNGSQVKVADYSLDKKLYDLYRSHSKEQELDLYPPTIGKGGKKSDIYRLGVLLLSLSIGELPKDSPLKVPMSLNPSLRDFINKCLIHDEQERWSADKLLSHPFVAISATPVAFPQAINIKDDKEDCATEAIIFLDQYSKSSRLLHEFEEQQVLGKGGFGQVLKVRNKLDSRIYALKKIQLNPSDRQLDRRIKREVKVLSRLNHENIVRYYNSWIEESYENDGNKSKLHSSDESSSLSDENKQVQAAASSVQWDMRNTNEEAYSSDDDEADDYDNFDQQQEDSLCSFIQFQHSENNEPAVDDENFSIKKNVVPKPKIYRFMYIQMEFCEKSTLRTAIDKGLYADVQLVWRLFREIVEGLLHIHSQNVIHRDLKPVNIFIDSKDRVKIGDFGLATDMPKTINLDFSMQGDVNFNESFQNVFDSVEDAYGFQTGNVGTALYVAPEINAAKSKLRYSEKVDIYSLGIIFFEMCYPPPVTAMERVKILANLRQPEIVCPEDINDKLSNEMIHILKWLLQHDVSKRPFCRELMDSNYFPPLLVQETELYNIISNTVAKSQSRDYKYLINCLLNQTVSTEFDFTYDMDISKNLLRNKISKVFCNVVEIMNKILQTHGAVPYSVPTLMPKSSIYDDTCVYLIDHGGSILNLPHDLRVPFARHIARKETSQLKRFTLEKVYREEKVFGFYPREQYEYAFDIVTPTQCSLMPDAEVISIVSEILSEFPSLENRNYYICLNHFCLLRAVLGYCDISDSEKSAVYDILDSKKNRNASKLQFQNMLLDLKISEKKVMKLIQFLDVSDSMDKVIVILQPVMQTKGEVGTLAKKAVKDLKTIVELADSFGVKFPIHICPSLVHEVKIYSGIVFQFVCELKAKKKKVISDVIAAGGRYDDLLSSFKFNLLSETAKGHHQTAVGASIAIEKIFLAESDSAEYRKVDVIIHSDQEMNREKSSLLKELWTLGYSASVLYDKNVSLNDVIDYCQNNGIPHLLLLNKTEPGIIKAKCFEKEKMNEKRFHLSELKDYLQSKSIRVNSEMLPSSKDIQRSHSISSHLPMNMRILTQDKPHVNRKRELTIRNYVVSTLQPLLLQHTWEVIAVDLKMSFVQEIAAVCDISKSDESLHQSFTVLAENNPKYKKNLLQIYGEICEVKSKKNPIVLYSIPESNCRIFF